MTTRWGFDPFGELDRVSFSLFDDPEALRVRVDVREDADNFYVDAEVPGFTHDDIEVTCENGLLSIQGERTSQRSREGENFHVSERRAGKFSRSFRLNDAVNEESVEARLVDGVLTVKIAKADEVKPRRIEVKAS